jgi:hypothetical protein
LYRRLLLARETPEHRRLIVVDEVTDGMHQWFHYFATVVESPVAGGTAGPFKHDETKYVDPFSDVELDAAHFEHVPISQFWRPIGSPIRKHVAFVESRSGKVPDTTVDAPLGGFGQYDPLSDEGVSKTIGKLLRVRGVSSRIDESKVVVTHARFLRYAAANNSAYPN